MHGSTMMTSNPNGKSVRSFFRGLLDRRLVVRTGDGKHLFTFDPQKQAIQVKVRGATYEVPLRDVEETLRTSSREVLTVYQDYDKLPCGHSDGVEIRSGSEYCVTCGKPCQS